MSSIDPRNPKWAPKEPRRPQDASDTSEESEDEYLRRAAPYEVRLKLGNIEYGQDVAYYDDNQGSIADITYLQKKQAFSDRSLYIKDKKGRVLRNVDKDKIAKRKEKKKIRFQKKKQEKLAARVQQKQDFIDFKAEMIESIQELKEMGLPNAFGKKQEEKTQELQVSESENSAGTHESDYEEEQELPITHQVTIKHHDKPITDIDINVQNSLLATGSLDYNVKLYNFTLMDETLTPFRSFEPIEGHPIRSVKYSLDNKHVLICAGGIQPKVFSKEGRLHFECVKGDMYMADMANTHGHTNMVTECLWHPLKPTYFLSSSLDSTVRVWDLEGRLVGLDRQLGHKTIHKSRNSNYTKIGVDCCAWAPNGNLIFGGCRDGSIQLWETNKGNSVQPKLSNYKAHQGEITSLKVFADNERLISRSQDGTLKLWDIRHFSQPIYSWILPCCNYKIQVDLSPDERFIVTGTSPEDRENESYLAIVSTSNYEIVSQIPYEKPIIAVKWHKEFNEIFIGSADAELKVLFKPRVSQGGVIDCLKRKSREIDISEPLLSKPIVTPYSLSQFRTNYTSKEKMHIKLREDPVLSQKPKEPLFDPGHDGRMSGINTVTQYILRSIHAKARPEDDPREAILSYNPQADKNRDYVDSAYKKTQPKPIFDLNNETFEVKEYLDKNQAQKCKSCGLKFCTCAKRRLGDDPVFSVEK